MAFRGFLRRRGYATVLEWKHDQNWRLTGPYVGTIGSGLNFGVHAAVRVYYSPEMIDWLCTDRTGTIPDGATIIKEMHAIDIALDVTVDANNCMQIQAMSANLLDGSDQDGTAAQDGWYWGNYTAEPQPPLAASEIGNPPIFDRSAITSLDFYGATDRFPLKPNPLWYPTGYVYENSLQNTRHRVPV